MNSEANKVLLGNDVDYARVGEAGEVIDFKIKSIMLKAQSGVKLWNTPQFNSDVEGSWVLQQENSFQETEEYKNCLCIELHDYNGEFDVQSMQYFLTLSI